jgi:hypothetical protein
MTNFAAGFCVGVAALWALLELMALRLKRTAPTKHNREPKRYVYNDQALNRKYRDAPGRREAPENDGVQYRFMGMGTMDEE